MLVDDLDGSDTLVESVSFSLDDQTFQIDLSEQNRDQLRLALSRFIEAARSRPAPSAPPVRGKPAHRDPHQLHAMREWGRKNGFQVSQFGKIPLPVLEAYEQAHARPAQHTVQSALDNGHGESAVPASAWFSSAP